MRNALLFLLLAGFLAAPAAARAQAPSAEPERRDSGDDDGEHVLDIPGVGPIPMPPGVRVFQPHPSPPPKAEAGPAPPPLAPKSPDQRRQEAQDKLFARLAAAEDEAQAQLVAMQLMRDWARSGSDTIDLLLARAGAAEAAGGTELARSLMDKAVALSPYWAEGFIRRARIKIAQNDPPGALADLETAARLDPKRFDALAAIGALAEEAGEKKRALDAYRKSLAISPRQDALRKNEERLRLELEGRDI